MKKTPLESAGRVLGTLLLVAAAAAAEPWPQWRGDVAGSGIAPPEAQAPLKWDAQTNVRWRTPLPERGNSTPAVWGDRVFVTQAIDAEKWRGVMCFDRADGKLLWKQGLTYDKPERTHRTNPYASASPAVDGERVVASFGSAGMVCYDFAGKLLWQRDFGPIDHVWGYSSSPVIHGDRVFHYHGPGKGAFLIALDKNTGKTIWKFDEPAWDVTGRTDGFRGQDDKGIVGSFSTPIIVKAADRAELVMSFPQQILAFDPAQGDVLWRCQGLNPLVCTSPVAADGVIVAMGGYHGNTVAVPAGGSGDVTDAARLWQKVRHNGGIGTGVVHGGHYYYHDSGGIAFCLEIKTGKEVWKARLPGHGKSWGSFLRVGDQIYALSQAGDTVVFKADPAGFEVLAHNDLDQMTNSSPVVSDGQLFLRTHEALWCIGQPSRK